MVKAIQYIREFFREPVRWLSFSLPKRHPRWAFIIDGQGHEWVITENDFAGINATCEELELQMWIDTDTGEYEVCDIVTANSGGDCMPDVANLAIDAWRSKY
jgi:hypothetical protein